MTASTRAELAVRSRGLSFFGHLPTRRIKFIDIFRIDI